VHLLPHAARAPKHAPAAAMPTTGELLAPALSDPHRVYVDGRVVGQTGASFAVPCGPHSVRIGSHGQLQLVVVPCGGSLAVSPRW
jgi:hypothetical protein